MISSSINVCMSNHFYTIGGVIRQQEEGGSIGSDATGELSRVFMLLWNDTLVKKSRSHGVDLDLYRRYVDDMVVVCRPIGLGWRFNNIRGILEYNEKHVEEDKNLSDTERTARVMASIANSINNQIQVTIDTPEKNDDNKMPDLKL